MDNQKERWGGQEKQPCDKAQSIKKTCSLDQGFDGTCTIIQIEEKLMEKGKENPHTYE